MIGSRVVVLASVLAAALACERAAPRPGPSPASVAPAAAPRTPDTPGELDARAVTDRHVVLRWKPVAGATGAAAYEVLAGERVLRAEAPPLDDRGVGPARVYCYAVRAVDAAGNRSPASPAACVRTPDLVAPTAPGAPAASAQGTESAVVSWSPSHDDVAVVGYEVLRDGHVVARAGAAATQAMEAGLVPGREHCWSVRARDAAGNASAAAGPACARTSDASRAGRLGAPRP
ncbi:hypothetical protein ACOQFB_09085 [Anaeromyxobacter sp. Red801]|uniref:hypothetical protein n=1 Tax=Anaeromyxobacter sp. Red801 TaxID=3411632 RepID=UPI003BA27F2D